jgi:hypothetical protein
MSSNATFQDQTSMIRQGSIVDSELWTGGWHSYFPCLI